MDPDLFDCLTSTKEPDVKPLTEEPSCVSFVEYGRIFQTNFSSLISGNEVSLTLIINDGTLE